MNDHFIFLVKKLKNTKNVINFFIAKYYFLSVCDPLTEMSFQANDEDWSQYLLSGDPPATLLGGFLPQSIEDGVNDALLTIEVKNLDQYFDPTSFPEGFNFGTLYDTVRRKIENAPDNDIPSLHELGDVQLPHAEEFPTGETAVAHLSALLTVPQDVVLAPLPQHTMAASSQDPFLGNPISGLPANFAAQQHSILQTPGTILIGSWYSPQVGNCHLYATPSGPQSDQLAEYPIIGFLRRNPIRFMPNIPFH